jgi:hypothetical protein
VAWADHLAQLAWADHLAQLAFFVKSPVLLGRAVLPGMQYGRIVHIDCDRSPTVTSGKRDQPLESPMRGKLAAVPSRSRIRLPRSRSLWWARWSPRGRGTTWDGSSSVVTSA